MTHGQDHHQPRPRPLCGSRDALLNTATAGTHKLGKALADVVRLDVDLAVSAYSPFLAIAIVMAPLSAGC